MSEEGREQEIGAYYGELGLTSEGDALFYMYDMNPGLQWVIAVEYEDKFHTMPDPLKTIATEMAEDDKVNKFLKNPSKAEAERDGKLVMLDPPVTVFVKKKGKRVDWSTAQSGSAGQQAEQASVQAGQYVWEPMTPEQATLAGQLAKDVSTLAWIVADEVHEAFVRQHGEDELPEDAHRDMIQAVYRSASYDFAKLWPTIRGSIVTDASEVLTLDKLAIAVSESEPEEFLEVLAGQHPLIIDAEFAKVLMKTVGESGIKPDADDRVKQAKRVVLFVELTSRFEVDRDTAKAMVSQAYDQIPF